ncbi:TATA box-binding protein-associated factor RNA polymerase I subunit C isoform X2 [Rhinoderma darwinii]
MGRLLEPHCHLTESLLTGKIREHTMRMTRLLKTLQTVPYQNCAFAYNTSSVRSFSYLTNGWLQDVPPHLLGKLVIEGMSEEWRNLQFQASLTGGALSWTLYPGTSCGCLIYPRGAAMNQLYFQQVVLDKSDRLEVKLRGDPAVFELEERIQQVSTGQFDQVLVGIRSAFHLATWSFSAYDPPKTLRVLSTRTPSTCINASPHLPGEFCVCTESGTLYLWNVENGLQRVRQDQDTVFFRDDPYWRWSDFTSHPRVLTFADRTGVQTADIRVPNSQGQDLFRIGQEALCRRGERVILARCLRETNPAYCLVTTQFSLYMVDERFPLVPVVKWDHMLERPPAFVSVLPGGSGDGSNKILLGTQHSQETLMVQYSGGHSSSCQLHLPAVCLPRISDSLNHQSPLLPHQHDTVLQRLQCPLAGLAAASPERTGDHLLVFQLTTAGDLFFQRLSQEAADAPSTPCDRGQSNDAQQTVSDSTPEEPGANHQSVLDSTAGTSISDHEPESRSPGSSHECSSDRTVPSTLLGAESKTSSCRWLRDLYRACTWRVVSSPRPRCSMIKLFDSEKISEHAEDGTRLRDCLRESMNGGALVRLAAEPASDKLEAVHSESWKDPLSQRLTASWEGQLGLWWEDHLGTNRERKIQALKERRRRLKLRRYRSPLSGSFTSSITSSHYDLDTASLWSCDGAPVSDATGHSPVGLVSADPKSPRSVPPVSSTSHDCAADYSRAGPSLSQSSSAIISSRSLRSKGIPHERRRTLQDFLSVLDCSTAVPEPAPSLPASQSQTPSQRLQPPSKRSRMGF